MDLASFNAVYIYDIGDNLLSAQCINYPVLSLCQVNLTSEIEAAAPNVKYLLSIHSEAHNTVLISHEQV